MKQYKVEDLLTYTIDGMDEKDYPEFCDAYISSAIAKNGQDLSEEELIWLHENDPDGVGNAIANSTGDWVSSKIDAAMQEVEQENFNQLEKQDFQPWLGM